MGFFDSIGSIVGAAIGIGLAVYTGGASLALMPLGIAGTIAAAAVVGGGIGYAAQSVVEGITGKGLSADSSTYANEQPVYTIEEGKAIARCYGRCRIAGNIIRSNDPGEDNIKAIIGHGQGEIASILAWRINDIDWDTLGDVDWWIADYVGSDHFKNTLSGTWTQTPIQVGGVDLFDQNACAYRGIAHTGFNFEKNSQISGLSSITVEGLFLKCSPIAATAGPPAFSRNPAVVMWDFYRNVEGYSIAELDVNAFKSLEELCDFYPTEGDGGPIRPLGPNSVTVKATSYYLDGNSNTYAPFFTFSLQTALTGTNRCNQWCSAENVTTNQRLNVDLGVAVVLTKIVLANSHKNDTTRLDRGIKDFAIQGSNTITDMLHTAFADGASGWTNVQTGLSATQYDEDDPYKDYEVASPGTAYRFYSIKIANNHGGSTYVGARDICFWGRSPRYTFDYNFDTEININDAKKLIWSSFNGRVVRSQGKLKPVWDWSKIADGSGSLTPKTSMYSFTMDNIVKGSFTWFPLKRANKINVEYLDASEGFKKVTVSEIDDGDIEERGEVTLDIQAYYITQKDVAARRCRRQLYRAMYADFQCKLTGLPSSQKLEVCDLVQVTHTLPDWTAKEFIVIDKAEDEYGRPAFLLEGYYAGVFDDVQTPVPASYFSNLANPYQPVGDCTNVTLSLHSGGTGFDYDAVKVTFDPPTDEFYHITHIYTSRDDSIYYKVGESRGEPYIINGLGRLYMPGDTCYVKLKNVNSMGILGEYSEAESILIPGTTALAGTVKGGRSGLNLTVKDATNLYCSGGSIEINGFAYNLTSQLTLDLSGAVPLETNYIYVKPCAAGMTLSASEFLVATVDAVWDHAKANYYHPTDGSYRYLGNAYFDGSNEYSPTFYPAVSGDDGTDNNGSFNVSSEYVRFGVTNISCFVRFANVAIPAGAGIKNAYVRLTEFSNWITATCDVNIHFNDIDDAVAPANSSEFNALALTAGTNWDFVEIWGNYTTSDTPNLKDDLQVVFDRAGWVNGNALMVLIKENASISNTTSMSIDRDSGIYKPELHVTYLTDPFIKYVRQPRDFTVEFDATNEPPDYSLISWSPTKKAWTTADEVTSEAFVRKDTYNANSILVADADDTPVNRTVEEQTLVGRITAGSIEDLSTTQVRTLINVEDDAVALATVKADADVADAITKKHTANADTDLDATFEATFVKKVDTVNVLSDITSSGANIEDAVTKKHNESHNAASHSDITSSGANIEDAVTKKHANTLDHTQGTDINLGGNVNQIIVRSTETVGGVVSGITGATAGNPFVVIAPPDKKTEAYTRRDHITVLTMPIRKAVRGGKILIASASTDNETKEMADYVCDGTSDDVEIQAAFDLVAGTPVPIEFTTGYFSFASAANFGTNGFFLKGQGLHTIFRIANGANCNLFEFDCATDKYGFTIRDIYLHGNLANNTSGSVIDTSHGVGKIMDVYFVMVNMHHFPSTVIEVEDAWGWVIEKCIIEESSGVGVWFKAGSNGRIENTKIQNNADHAVLLGSAGETIKKITLTGNELEARAANKGAICAQTSVSQCTFTSNQIQNLSAVANYGVLVSGGGFTVNSITGNIFSGTSGATRMVDGIKLGSAGCQYNIITGNTFVSDQLTGSAINDLGSNNTITPNIIVP